MGIHMQQTFCGASVACSGWCTHCITLRPIPKDTDTITTTPPRILAEPCHGFPLASRHAPQTRPLLRQSPSRVLYYIHCRKGSACLIPSPASLPTLCFHRPFTAHKDGSPFFYQLSPLSPLSHLHIYPPRTLSQPPEENDNPSAASHPEQSWSETPSPGNISSSRFVDPLNERSHRVRRRHELLQ